MPEKGSTTITYQFLLYHKHLDWIDTTRELYNEVLEFYFSILLNREELLAWSNHRLLRELEILTVGTRQQKAGKEPPSYSLEAFPKLPLYFRRAAINAAIGMARSYFKRRCEWLKRGNKVAGGCPSPPSKFIAAPVYYKGMYRNFTDIGIEMKLYTGEKWVWITFGLKGRKIPEEGRKLSPMLKRRGDQAWLHVPVLLPVEDIRTVEQRMAVDKKFLALYFPDGNCMAAGVVFEQDMPTQKHPCFYGGDERKAYRDRVLRHLKKSMESRAPKPGSEEYPLREIQEKENERLYEKILSINEHYAHQVSKRIVEYCMEEKIPVLVVPRYEQSIDFTTKRYLKTNEFEWLGRKIIGQLRYKAFRQGIVVCSVRPYHIVDTCSRCGSRVKRYNEGHRPGYQYYGGKLYQCPAGHQGNAALNAAENLGRLFLNYYN